MKFMIIYRYKDSFDALPQEKKVEILDARGRYSEKLTKEGKLKERYMLGNMKGVMVIYDLNSSEDLARLFSEAPGVPFVDAEITPLVEMDVARKFLPKK